MMPYHKLHMAGKTENSMLNEMAQFGTPMQSPGMYSFWTAWNETATTTPSCANCGT